MKKHLPYFSIEYLWVATVLVGIFAFVNTHPLRPHDFWFHAAAGREIVATGSIPNVDTFSHTADNQPYESYKIYWLMEVFFYLLYRAGGAVGVVFVHSLMITSAYALVLLVGWHISGSLRAASFSTLFAAALGINDWNVRPQAVGFLICALYLLAIGALRRSAKPIWLLVFPLGMFVWVNSHGTFVLGFLLLGACFVSEMWHFWRQRDEARIKIFVAALLLSVLACLLNPRGFGVLYYVRGMVANPVVQSMVPEWAPPSFEKLGGQLFYMGLLFAAVVLALSPRRPDLFQLLVFLGFATMGLKTSRGSAWFGLIMAPVLAFHLNALGLSLSESLPERKSIAESKPPPAILNWVVLGFLLLLAIISLPWFKDALPFPPPKAGLISYETPIAATESLLENQWPGFLFNTMSFGSYLDWAAQPDYPVFVDSRIELYSPQVWRDYLEIGAALPDWEERLAAYEINTLMLSPYEHENLIQAATSSPDWQQVYGDESAVIFTRY